MNAATQRERAAPSGQVISCLCCGSTELEYLTFLSGLDAALFENRSLASCTTCGFEIIDADISEAQLTAFYDTGYWEEKRPPAPPLRQIAIMRAPALFKLGARLARRDHAPSKRFLAVLPLLPPRPVSLEFGAGSAALSVEFRRRCPSAVGDVTEASGYWDHQYRRFGLRKVSDNLRALEPARYDLIMSSHVFEHLIDPEGAMRSIHRALKPTGVLFMEMPNSEPRNGTAPALRRATDAPHVTFWNERCFPPLLNRLGYAPIEVASYGPSNAEYRENPTRKATWSDRRHPDGLGRKLRVIAQVA